MRRLLCNIVLCDILIGAASAGLADPAYEDAPFDMDVASLPPGYRASTPRRRITLSSPAPSTREGRSRRASNTRRASQR
jgi:hypothetical protein